VTITGKNFLTGAVTAISNTELTNIVVVNETTITAKAYVQANAPAGVQDVRVSLPGTGAGPTAGSMGTCAKCVTLF
jgi:hypothetical protein